MIVPRFTHSGPRGALATMLDTCAPCEECLMAASPALSQQLRGLVRLTRWQEFVPFTVPLTVQGALLAQRGAELTLDWRLLAVTLANLCALAYAFMINDIEDAPDDAREPARAARNPISNGEITPRLGYAACALVALLALGLYALGGGWVLAVGALTLALCHLYSWRPVRLKAYAVTDVVSHSLMLSGLLMLVGYYLYDTQPAWAWLVVAAVTLISVYGQLYNQLRDFAMDQQAGLRNTAIMVGQANAQRLMYAAIAGAVLCFVAAFVVGVFPWWLLIVIGVSGALSLLFRPTTDMRGGQAIDASGAVQVRVLIAMNIMTVGWWLVLALGWAR
jgi:4-hydroxybenzoate polyprenyltransferase